MKTKFIKVATSKRLPEPGTRVVIDKNGLVLTSRFHERFSTDEWWLGNYKFWLMEVTDIEEELKETLKSTHLDLETAITALTAAKEKIEYYQETINNLRNEQREIPLPKDIDE